MLDFLSGPIIGFFYKGPGAGLTVSLLLLILSRLLPDKSIGRIVFTVCKFVNDIGRAKVGVAFWVPIRKKFIQHSFQVIFQSANDALGFYDLKEGERLAILKKWGINKELPLNT